MMTKRMLACGLFLLGMVLAACTPLQSPVPEQPSIPRGKYDPPRTVADFTLINQDGKPMRLSDLRGKVVWLFFGYTHCPDFCPLTMGMMKTVKDKLGTSASQIAFVFISVDDARDTPDVVRQFVRSFDENFIGLTGDEAKVQQIAKDYSSQFDAPTPSPHEQHDRAYKINHTGYSYLLDRQGRWHFVYLPQTPVETIVADIKELLNL